jgi:hypothetical protein
LLSFALDTNCLIAVDENRPVVGYVRTLADAHAQGRADAAVIATSASEKHQRNRYIQNLPSFRSASPVLALRI